MAMCKSVQFAISHLRICWSFEQLGGLEISNTKAAAVRVTGELTNIM